MEIFLAKLYLFLVFGTLVIITLFLGFQIQLKQNLENSLNSIQKKKNLDDKAYENQFKLGQIYLRKKMYNRAIEEFRECFTKWDKNDRLGLASLLNTLGFTYYQLKEYRIAIYYYQTALNLTPDYFTSLTNLAYLYQKQGKIQKLNETYTSLVEFDPTNKKTKEIKN